MKTFPCNCGNPLFFDSTVCLNCKSKTGLCPECRRIVPLVTNNPDGLRCGQTDCGAALRRCANSVQNGCNGCVTETGGTTDKICDYCALTSVIPDLTVADNQHRWTKLEQAKRRVLYTLDELGFQFRPSDPLNGPRLSFEFKADADKAVHTGHENGVITINIREANDVDREKARVAFDEPKRTLVGHFRHELGHYFWATLVKDQCVAQFRDLFGDERSPDYASALEAYHTNGPLDGWSQNYVSAYATMHPWEDFAETFRTWLDMVSILQTASHFELTSSTVGDIDSMIKTYQRVGTIVNELNRDMGLLDLVPEVFVPPVIEKLKFVAGLQPVQGRSPA